MLFERQKEHESISIQANHTALQPQDVSGGVAADGKRTGFRRPCTGNDAETVDHPRADCAGKQHRGVLRDAAHEGTLPGDDGESVFLESLYAGVEIPEDLEERLGKQIDSWNSVEKNVTRNTRTATLKWIGGVAAAILLLFTVGMVLNDRQDGQQYSQKDTYDNAEDAYAQTQKALLEMSESLNMGLNKVDKAVNKE